MQKFTSLRLRNLAGNTGLVKLGLVILAGLIINIGRAAPPANDMYSSAAIISGDSGTIAGSNVGATTEPGEPYAGNLGASVWYKWTASTNETTKFDLRGSAFGAGLAYVLVYTNSASGISNLSLPYIALGYIQGSFSSKAIFQAVAGQTYYITVAGSLSVTGAITGAIKLNWSSGPPLVVPPNDNFANASPLIINGLWGSTNGDNSLATSENGEPGHAGFAPSHSVWYQWVAPQDGEVEFDTIGSDSLNDTVLAVYTGVSLAALSQVAANDDLYPYEQENYTAQNIYNVYVPNDTTNPPVSIQPVYGYYYQPYGGPSGLRFNAVGGTTYYIAVDSKSSFHYTGYLTSLAYTAPTGPGPFKLNWAYHPSGVFRFATENIDQTGIQDTNGNPMLLYQCAENETSRRRRGIVDLDLYNTTMHTYYDYNVPGVLVTVTRVAGSSGRVLVDYTTENGNTNLLVNGDKPAMDGADYSGVSGTLTFNDFEMSKTILIQIGDDGGFSQPNRDFTVVLSNPRLDDNELKLPDVVSPPQVDSTFGRALVRILDVDIDPRGESQYTMYSTNNWVTWTNVPPTYTNTDISTLTNTFYTAVPTNAVFNFMKANFRVPRDITNWWKGTPITVYVTRTGTNTGSASISWRVGSYFLDKVETLMNIYHPLQPGSDYATPDPTNSGAVNGLIPDFIFGAAGTYSGTLSFTGGNNWDPQPIQFTIYDNGLTQFNEDFHIELYDLDSHGNPIQVGMVAETTVTILFDDRHPPAGSVDEHYNADFSHDMAPPFDTVPQQMFHPGTDQYGEVYGLAILPNNETVIVGDFVSYDPGQSPGRNGIALINTDGSLDTSFNPGSGMGGGFGGTGSFIYAVALNSVNQFVIGGNFTSYNGTSRNGIARLNANGTLDSTFLSGTGLTGADGTVWAVALQPDGKILVGGAFTHFNNTPCNYIVRLNANGVLDASFSLAAICTSPVYALALQPNGQILVGGDFAVNGQNYSGIARLNANGSLDTSFNPGSGTDGAVLSVVVQPDGKILMGGDFTDVNGSALNSIARLNTDGSIDTAGFFIGTGADGTVYSILYSTNVTTSVSITNNNGTFVTNTIASTNNSIYVGGQFDSVNGTRRVGFARLNTDGTVDTTFLDTAYNQFAGLVRVYSYDTPEVFTSGVQSDGSVMIGGFFNQVGGGQFSTLVGINSDPQNYDSNVWPERKTRDGIRNRNNVARLIGGSTPGPGNIGLLASYSANRSQQSLYVSLIRTNGSLGPLSANFSVQPELAQSGADYIYDAADPLYWIAWEYLGPSRMHSDGLFGASGLVTDIYGSIWAGSIPNLSQVIVSLPSDTSVAGNLTANFQLANPSVADQFYLGGQNIPLGGALGISVSPFTLIDDAKTPGTFGFASSTFIATNASAAISVLRSNGVSGQVSIYGSTSNGTAVAGLDYVAINPNPKLLNFGPGEVSKGFNVSILDHGYIYTNFTEKTVILRLSGLVTPGAAYGISNAVLRLINPNFQGYLTFSATNFNGTQSSGFISFIVNRVSGSFGALSVQYATTNGPPPNGATNGVDYIGVTNAPNTLSWISGDVSPRIVNIPLIPTLTVGPNKYFAVSLFNPQTNGSSCPALFYVGTPPTNSITSATLTIINDNSYGTLQFSAPRYLVNENGGYATITVIRTGGDAGSVSVNFATTNGTALAGVNYTTTTGVLAFAAGQIATNFNVPIQNDGLPDPTNFYFNVTLSNPTNATLGSLSNVVVNILAADRYAWPPGSRDTAFNPGSGMNGDVLALALQSSGLILAGGSFTTVNNVPENYVARLNLNGSLDPTFLNGLAGANGPVYALVNQTNDRILVGGAFTSFNNVSRNYLARLMTDGSLDTSFNTGAGADNAVNALAETFIGGVRKIYVGGAFGHIYNWSIASPGIARLNDDGTVDASFATGLGADGAVYAIAVYPTNSIYAGKVLMGGAFTHYNGTHLNYIARLNADGSVDTTFTNSANGAVSAIAIQPDGRVLVGGNFIQFNGVPLNRIARLNADGSLDAGFTAAIGAGVNNTVKGIALQADNRIVLVGQFTQIRGLTYNRIVRLLPTGAVDTTINFGNGANSDVDAVVVQPWDGMIVIGGAFTQFNNQPYYHLVRLYGGSMGGSIIGGGNGLVIPAGSALVNESFTPANNIIDPGETVTLLFAFTNSAGNNVSNLVATLLATNGVTSPSGPQTNYGLLIAGGPSALLPFSFTASGTNGQSIAATFQLQSGTNNLGTAVFTYMLGTLTNTFANTNLIIINDYAAASPYPSTINVSGVGGSLIKATVTFAKLTHSWPADIDALLESPSQQSTLLMAHAGGGFGVNGVTLTFDDDASTCLLQTQIVSGTYKPTAYFPVATFPAPAPPVPYATNLSSLYDGNPNGAWSLFVIDDTPINDGVISNGWSLNLITASPIASQPLQFGNIMISNGKFILSITNPPVSTIIQASTNLTSTNWIPIYTNIPPFSFTDLNTSVYPYRFYRALFGP
jgi:uncharacterized delta-60 repeat protein